MFRQREKGEIICVIYDACVHTDIKVPLPPAMAVFLLTVTVTAVAAITIFPVGAIANS